MVLGGFWGPFGRSFWSKNAFVGHLFLDDFMDDLFDGFGRLFDLILKVFGMQKHVQNGIGGNMKNLCFL